MSEQCPRCGGDAKKTRLKPDEALSVQITTCPLCFVGYRYAYRSTAEEKLDALAKDVDSVIKILKDALANCERAKGRKE